MRGLPGPPSASPATNHKKASGKRLKKKRSSGASLLDLSKMENAMPAAMTALNLVKMAMYLRGKNGVIAYGSTDDQSLGNYLGTTLSTQPKIRFVMVNPVRAKAKLIESYYDSKSLDYIQKMTNLDFYLCSTDSTNKTAQHMRLECVPQPRIVYTTVTDIRTEKAAAFFDLGDVSQGESKTTYDGIKAHIKNHTTKALIAQLVLKDSLTATTTEPSYKAYIIKAKTLDMQPFDDPYAKPTQTTLKQYFQQQQAENPEFYNKFIFDDLLEISKYKLSLFVEKSSIHDRLLKYKFTDA